MPSSIMDYWPHDFPARPQQIEALEWLAEQSKTHRYLVLESPTGSGKSAMAMTYARYRSGIKPDQQIQSSYILTPQKILQQQYMNDFANNKLVMAKQLFGRANYQCKSGNCNCEIGSTINKCECSVYKAERDKLIESGAAVMNYSSAFSFFRYTNDLLKERKTMVIDECHNLEQILVDFQGLSVTKRRCDFIGARYVQMKTIGEFTNWLRQSVVPKAENRLDALKDSIQHLSRKDPSFRKIAGQLISLDRFLDGCDSILSQPKDVLKRNYVLVDGFTNTTLKPVYPKTAFAEFLEPKASSFLFLSGTIPADFEQNLGLDKDQVARMSLDSDFAPENRPYIYIPTAKMNAAWKDDLNGKKAMQERIEDLLDIHKDEKGIIHTSNYQIADWVAEFLKKKNTHKVFYFRGSSDLDEEEVNSSKDSREVTIDNFLNCESPSVIISPSLTEGIDLKHDKGRFNIVVKLPYPYLGDKWVQKRMELSKEWYSNKTLIDLLQASGRTVRNSEDYGAFYILDKNWDFLLHQVRHKIPKWWMASYQRI